MNQNRGFLLILGIIMAMSAFAQDKLILMPHMDTLLVKVKQIGSDKIYYIRSGNYTIDSIEIVRKNVVARLIMEDGRVFHYTKIYLYPKTLKNYPMQAIKVSPFTSFFGSSFFAYEQGLGRNTSIEYGLGLIGLGFNPDMINHRRGVLGRLGYKYYFKPFDPVKRIAGAPLKGYYFRPELGASYYHGDEMYIETKELFSVDGNVLIKQSDRRYEKFGIALLLNFGYQFIIKDRFCIDLFFGAGAGYGKQKLIEEKVSEYYLSREEYHHLDQIYHDESLGTGLLLPHQEQIMFAGQWGFKVGYLFYGSKKQKK